MSTSAIDDFPYISNEDVAVLYDIVSAAEESTATPFRALFAAYDQVLEQYGIEAAQDQVYFRFLLRMREHQKSGQGLLSQFESLLERLGIQVDFGDDDEAENFGRKSRPNETRPKVSHKAVSQSSRNGGTNSENPTISRRASFSSFQENTSTHLLEAELNRRRNRPRSIDFDESANARQRHKVTQADAVHTSRPLKDEISREQRALGLKEYHIDEADRPRRSIEDLPSRTKSRTFQSSFAAKHIADLTLDDSETSGYSSELTEEYTHDDIYAEPIPEVKDVDMLQAAKSLRFHHVAAQCTKLFRTWALAAKASALARSVHEQIAGNQYTSVLQRSVIDQWTITLRIARQQRETEQFFEALESKAEKARAIFLLTKAFTHWAASAEEQVQRASAARRHILQTRYFNAWRNLSMANERKVRDLALTKFLQTWRRRTTLLAEQNDVAEESCARQLEKAVYTHWFWRFCDRRAPTWYGSKLKITFFESWASRARETTAKIKLAEELRKVVLVRRVFVKWAERLAASRHAEQLAASFRKQNLLRPVLEDLHREVEYGPSYEQLLGRVDGRIARTTFLTWEHRTEVYRHATRINELRIQRNAWTTWNDQLRCQALQRTIQERVKRETLYHWAISERLMLFIRVADGNLKQKIFTKWRSRSNELCDALGCAQHAAAQRSEHRAKAHLSRQWASQSESLCQNQERAVRFRERHLSQSALTSWIARLRHIELMESRAQHASFFVIASRSINRWQEATLATQRNKRRNAYTTLRQRVKRNTASGIFQQWHAKSMIVLHNGTLAWECHNDHLQSRKDELFEHWYSRTLTYITSTEQAIDVRDLHVSSSTFNSLRHRLETLRAADDQARAFAAECASVAATSALRQLNWQLFQRKRLEETATSLAERTAKRRFKGIFKWWAEQTARKRRKGAEPVASPSVVNTETPMRRTIGRGRFARAFPPPSTITAARRHVLSAFDDASTPGSSTSTPGYLKTPSRHQRNLNSQASVFYTPAGLPQSQSASQGLETPASASPALQNASGRQPSSFLRRLRGDRVQSSLRSSLDSGANARSVAARTGTGAGISSLGRTFGEPGADDTLVEDNADVAEAGHADAPEIPSPLRSRSSNPARR